MTTTSPKPRILQALDALQQLDRRQAVQLLRDELSNGPATGERWSGVAKLAATIGAWGIETEAMRRFAETTPQKLDSILAYGQVLARHGKSQVALDMVDALPDTVQAHPAVLHFRSMVASERGDFATAETGFGQALAAEPLTAQIWYALSVVKTFKPEDPHIALMESLRGDMAKQEPQLHATFLAALAKAYDDIGDYTRAASVLNEQAPLMRGLQPYDGRAWNDLVEQTLRDYTSEGLAQLTPSTCVTSQVIFVNGLPRSGTTLVEQILTSHSAVAGGDELNLSDALLMPAGDLSLAAAKAYQARSGAADPWGDIARDYMGLVAWQFGTKGRVVDKTLNRSVVMGLLLHMLPKTKAIWMRRNPEDNAASLFRTQFRDSMPWSWSAADIAERMRGEDRLYRHWLDTFPDRILSVPYEELVQNPEDWTRRILAHVGLDEEPQVFTPHKNQRSVMTASVAQVRNPISTARIGAAEAYPDFVAAFRSAYYR